LDLGSPAELIHELIALFEEDVPVRLTALQKALDASDAPGAMMEAHQLKGALSSLGLARFAELAAQIEAQIQEGHLGQAPRLAESLPAAYEEALRALNTAYPQR
jgi:HPt (histidine-containing phosphotransfer) domain-containing protein